MTPEQINAVNQAAIAATLELSLQDQVRYLNDQFQNHVDQLNKLSALIEILGSADEATPEERLLLKVFADGAQRYIDAAQPVVKQLYRLLDQS